ncbi:hypothetical protein BDW74DRAFT_144650 [Aspergillus multicolor]|uniref:uncharacterized protein n=1 Tax=Aspergillus multicolor TaxID=41759 RepID=UPI003CCD0294
MPGLVGEIGFWLIITLFHQDMRQTFQQTTSHFVLQQHRPSNLLTYPSRCSDAKKRCRVSLQSLRRCTQRANISSDKSKTTTGPPTR